jgi:hypothetical protein
MNEGPTIFLFLIGVVFLASMLTFHFSRARSILEQWAELNGYEIVSSEHRFLGGPFWWRKGKGQEVYYVTIRTSDGQLKRGWFVAEAGGWEFSAARLMLSGMNDISW